MSGAGLSRLALQRPLGAFVGYLALTIVMTWPLTAGLHRDVPGDLGDSLLNLWILGWGAENVPRLLTGRMGLADYWNANIFHPEPLALSLSEHLFGQVIQILPVYWLTGNLILAYNLLVITSFALSGLGMFLLVRDMLAPDDPAPPRAVVAASLLAGLIYAFLPFRIAQIAHVQSLSSQWMPFALYGFRRYARSGRVRPLAGGALALLMQNWSCGYYLIFFAPFVPVFVVHQLWSAGRLHDWRRWAGLVVAAAVVAAGTWPFLTLYLAAQRVHGFERPLGEVIRYSADVYSYLTAPEALRVWGSVMQAYPKPEGELFSGFVPLMLFITAAAVAGAAADRPQLQRHRRARTLLSSLLFVIVVVQSLGVVAILLTGGFITSIAGLPVRATNPTRILVGLAAAFALLLIVSARARTRAGNWMRSNAGIAVLLTLLAMWLSLGPMPQSRGRALQGLALYDVLYQHVPGFEGLRVPARYAMVAGVFLSAAAGFGAAALLRRRRAPALLGGALAVLFLIEAAFLPMPVNVTWGDGPVQPPARVAPADEAPAVYHQLAGMPDSTVVLELPFGDSAWELRYVYYSTVHWKPLVNGYSGAFPQGYKVRVAQLQRIAEDPEAAWRAIRDAGTTHVVLHDDAYPPADAVFVRRFLEDHFAVEIARFNGDRLFAMPGHFP